MFYGRGWLCRLSVELCIAKCASKSTGARGAISTLVAASNCSADMEFARARLVAPLLALEELPPTKSELVRIVSLLFRMLPPPSPEFDGFARGN